MIKFITPCFVRVKDAKKRTDLFKWLFDRWYAGRYQINMANSIIVVGLEDGCVDVAHCNTSDELAAYGLIDCGENIGMFKALAAMNDENDRDQWFTDTAGDFCLCLSDKWSTEWLKENFEKYYCYWRKATVEELVEHFKER
nr:MAG TPA: hypothetical protein [Herelleviridae sp.]